MQCIHKMNEFAYKWILPKEIKELEELEDTDIISQSWPLADL